MKGTDLPQTAPDDQDRRSLLSWLLGSGAAASLASFFYQCCDSSTRRG
jgi:hypothetical protein